MGLRTQVDPESYGTGATGQTVALTGTTPIDLTVPTTITSPTVQFFLRVPVGVTETVSVVPRGSDRTTSGLAITGGESLTLPPVAIADAWRVVATATCNVHVSCVGVMSEG
jgi:hypothetical protein